MKSQRAKNSTMAASLQALACATLVVVILVPHACMASNKTTTLQDKCESYAGGDRSSYDYCVWTLRRADNKSATTADELGLATIAARFARATAKATRAKIAALQANETVPPARRGSLAACARVYAAAVRRLGHAASAARAGNLQTALTLLEEATGTPVRCGAAFVAAREDSPLADSDFGLDDQIELAIALLSPPPPPRTSPLEGRP